MELKKYKLGEIGRIVTGKTPSTKEADNFNGNIPFITPEDIANGFRIDKTNRFISENGYASIKSNTLNSFSVLVGCIGSDMGNVAFSEDKCATNQQINAITDIKESFCSLFIYYLLSRKKQYFRQFAGSTTTPILPKSVFENIEVMLPTLSTQRKIASVLSSLDSKITLNRRINTKLETIAKRLYDYWFVQFDFPDETGKPYKSSGGKMVWNDVLKREIPEGWGNGILSDVANITMGQSPEGSSFNEEGEGIIFYQGSTDFGMRCPKVRMFTTEPTRMAKQGDVLMSVRAPVGALNISNQDCCIGRGLAAMNSKIGSITHLWFLMDVFKHTFENKNTAGTTFGSITKEELFNLPVVLPPKDIITAFNAKTLSIFNYQLSIEKETVRLTALRDKLLPLLMNGQVEVA